MKRSLAETHPELLEEWDFDNNVKDPYKIVNGSAKKVNWVCQKNIEHKWDMQIRQRTTGEQGCPFCAGRRVLPKDSLGGLRKDLLNEWDCYKNKKDPFSLTLGSGHKSWWICSCCGHSWSACVYSRTIENSGCPSCSGHITTAEKSLGALFPELTNEINENVDVFSVSPNSHKIVSWKCKNDERHFWPATIKSRTNGSGCPFCCKLRVLPEESFASKNPELLEKWDFDKNKEDPYSLGSGSGKKCWWLCPKGHSYSCSLRYMVSASPSCNVCHPKGSRTGNGWLDEIGVKPEYREKYININGKRYFADGFDPETNTVYEYMGDFWHGNPDKYDSNKKHPISNKTYGQLYEETMNKIAILKSAGYNVIYKWGT